MIRFYPKCPVNVVEDLYLDWAPLGPEWRLSRGLPNLCILARIHGLYRMRALGHRRLRYGVIPSDSKQDTLGSGARRVFAMRLNLGP